MTHRFDREVAQIDPGLLQLDRLETLQVNLGNVCNQRCRHCHVQAGPDGKKIMTRWSRSWIFSGTIPVFAWT